MTTLTIILYVLGIIYLLDKAVDIIHDRIDDIKEQQANNNAAKRLIANHPEMKGITLGKGADLLAFDTDKDFKKMILANDEPGNNIAIEDDDRYGILVVDMDELEDDDDD